MTPLEQARKSGYSDEEIIQQISDKDPEWGEKYIKARKSGYSDEEILTERQRRKSEAQQQQQVPEEEAKPEKINPFKDVKDALNFLNERFVDFTKEKVPEGTDPKDISPFKGTKAGLSAATLGLTENIPGLSLSKEERESLAGSDKVFEFLSGILPIEGAVKIVANPITKKTVQWAAGSPFGKKTLETFGRLTGLGAAAATLKAGESLAKGELPSIEEMVTDGATWVALDVALNAAGTVGRFAKALLSKSKQANKPAAKVLRETMNEMKERGVNFSDSEKASAVALDIIEDVKPTTKKISTEDLKIRKIDQRNKQIIMDDSAKLSKEIPENIDANEILNSREQKEALKIQEVEDVLKTKEKGLLAKEKAAKEAQRIKTDEALDSIGKRAVTEVELGNSVKNGIDQEIQKAREIYKPLYEFSETVAEGITGNVDTSVDTVKSIIKDLKSLKTKPSGYQTVLNSAETALKDLGISTLEQSSGAGFEVTERIPVSKMMELKRRLAEIIDYDVLDWKIKNKLKPLVASLRNDIKTSLKVSPEALSSWTTGETEYAKAAKRFNIDNIRKIRGDVRPERIAKDISSPTVLRELKKTLPEEVYNQVERELLEQIRGSDTKAAIKKARELSTSLSEDANKVAKDIINVKTSPKNVATAEKPARNKVPISSKGRIKKIQDSLLEDLAISFEKGTRPNEILDLWKTNKGQKIVLDSIKESPGKKDAVDYLNRQSLNDVIKTILNKENVVDFTKINRLVRDKNSKAMLELIGGKEAVEFFNQLEHRAKQLEQNIRLHSTIKETQTATRATPTGKQRIPRERGENILAAKKAKNAPFSTVFNNYLKELGITPTPLLKGLLYGVGFGANFKATSAIVVGKSIYKLLNKPSVRKAFKNVTSKGISNRQMVSSIRVLNEALKEDSED